MSPSYAACEPPDRDRSSQVRASLLPPPPTRGLVSSREARRAQALTELYIRSEPATGIQWIRPLEEWRMNANCTSARTGTGRAAQLTLQGGQGRRPHARGEARSFRTAQCSRRAERHNTQLLRQRFRTKWAHSACPSWEWFKLLRPWFQSRLSASGRAHPRLYALDIGCNKGLTSAKLLASFSPHNGVTPRSVHQAIVAYGRQRGIRVDRPCGVCGDCNDEAAWGDAAEELPATVHCFEPMLLVPRPYFR